MTSSFRSITGTAPRRTSLLLVLVAAVASIASLDTDTPTYDVVATVDVPPFVLDEGALEQTFELHAVATSYTGTIGMQVAIAATWDGLPPPGVGAGGSGGAGVRGDGPILKGVITSRNGLTPQPSQSAVKAFTSAPGEGTLDLALEADCVSGTSGVDVCETDFIIVVKRIEEHSKGPLSLTLTPTASFVSFTKASTLTLTEP